MLHKIDYHTLKRLLDVKHRIEQAIEDYENRAMPLTRVERNIKTATILLKDVRKTVVLQPDYA